MEAEKEPKSILPDVKNEDSHEGYVYIVSSVFAENTHVSCSVRKVLIQHVVAQ